VGRLPSIYGGHPHINIADHKPFFTFDWFSGTIRLLTTAKSSVIPLEIA
jgi:hypothetical protein